MSTEPKRLRTGSDALAASIGSLQQALPSEARMAALAERLTQAGAPVEMPAPLDPPPPAPRSELRMVRAAKLVGPETLTVLAALLFGAGLITMVLLDKEDDAPLKPLPTAPAPATATPAAATRAAEPPAAAGPSDTATAAPSPSPASAPAPVTATPTLPAAPAVTVGSAPVPAVEQGTPTAAVAPTRPTARNEGREEGRALATSGRAKPTTVDSANEGAPLAANTVVETEIELLKQARSALGADPLQAFALSERCRGQYPNGSFAQEREYIAISALVGLGRTSDARSRASLFRMHYPNSAYLPRLARMLGE